MCSGKWCCRHLRGGEGFTQAPKERHPGDKATIAMPRGEAAMSVDRLARAERVPEGWGEHWWEQMGQGRVSCADAGVLG